MDKYFENFQAFAKGGFTGGNMDPDKLKALNIVPPSTGWVVIPIEQGILMEAASLYPLMRISSVQMSTSESFSTLPPS